MCFADGSPSLPSLSSPLLFVQTLRHDPQSRLDRDGLRHATSLAAAEDSSEPVYITNQHDVERCVLGWQLFAIYRGPSKVRLFKMRLDLCGPAYAGYCSLKQGAILPFLACLADKRRAILLLFELGEMAHRLRTEAEQPVTST